MRYFLMSLVVILMASNAYSGSSDPSADKKASCQKYSGGYEAFHHGALKECYEFAENENVTSEKIIFCGNATIVYPSFSYCLDKSRYKNVTAGKIKACDEATYLQPAFEDCLDYSTNSEITEGVILNCGKETDGDESFSSCLDEYVRSPQQARPSGR